MCSLAGGLQSKEERWIMERRREKDAMETQLNLLLFPKIYNTVITNGL